MFDKFYFFFFQIINEFLFLWRIGKYFDEKPNLTEESVAGASKAASALLKWIKAAHSFYYVNKKVKPKKEKLKIAEAEAKTLKE